VTDLIFPADGIRIQKIIVIPLATVVEKKSCARHIRISMGKKNDSSTSSRGAKTNKRSRASAKGGTRGNRGRNQHQPTFDDRRPESAVDEDNENEDDCEGSEGEP
jgi:hypothetical protein